MQPVAFRYAPRLALALLACPFCREMFEEGEAKACPVCGMALAKFENLPPSIDALHDEAGVPTAPELEVLPFRDLGRGKGAIVALAAVGIVLFFLPWVRLTMPDIVSYSGFDLATNRLGWLWASFTGWSVLIPTVMSRRTIAQLRGARVAAAALAAAPSVAIAVLLLFPPHGRHGVPVRYTWDWPFWTMLAVSLAAVVVSVRLGGRVDDIKVARGTSSGQHLH
jgi:hypothetical protein